jgi:mono/diheme cytochrome c family protein
MLNDRALLITISVLNGSGGIVGSVATSSIISRSAEQGVLMRLLVVLSLLVLVGSRAASAEESRLAGNEVGAQAYAASCGACHQANGQGVPGAFPPLVGHAPEVLAKPGGRDYLVRLVLYGLQGEINVAGNSYNGAMPPMGAVLNDAELAGALNYVLSNWDNAKALPANFVPFSPADFVQARSADMTAEQVYALRRPDASPVQQMASAPPSFTEDQVERGHAAYRHNCQDCHGMSLNDGEFGGAPLNGAYFAKHWGEGNVAGLYGYIRAKMPPDRPGKLNPQTYADITAFLLSRNGYATNATELPTETDALQRMSLKH